MKRFAKINGKNQLTIFAKCSILDFWNGSEYITERYDQIELPKSGACLAPYPKCCVYYQGKLTRETQNNINDHSFSRWEVHDLVQAHSPASFDCLKKAYLYQ